MDDAAKNFYAPPEAQVDGPTRGEVGGDAALIRAYVGKNADAYLRHFGPRLQGTGRAIGFSLGAFFLGLLYFLYRKMYLYGFLIFAAQIGLAIVLGVLIGVAPQIEPLSNIVSLALGIAVALFAHELYYRHVTNKIEEARAEGYEGAALLAQLSQRGGTNLWLPLLLVLGMFGLVVLVAMAAASSPGF